MKQVAEYRQQAAECRRLAAQMQVDEHREQLLTMAATWDRMADERERMLRMAEQPSFKTSKRSWPG